MVNRNRRGKISVGRTVVGVIYRVCVVLVPGVGLLTDVIVGTFCQRCPNQGEGARRNYRPYGKTRLDPHVIRCPTVVIGGGFGSSSVPGLETLLFRCPEYHGSQSPCQEKHASFHLCLGNHMHPESTFLCYINIKATVCCYTDPSGVYIHILSLLRGGKEMCLRSSRRNNRFLLHIRPASAPSIFFVN